jgi:hypothetical protein
LADLSLPEAEHVLLELPTNRAEYVGVLEDIGDYPARSPIGHRTPSHDEVAALNGVTGRWRAIVLLDDERALKNATGLFHRVFVLNPLFDCGAWLYAAWHDPVVEDEHARRLAEQAGLLLRAGPLLNAGTAILAPDHLPGSWNPRPGWRKPQKTEDLRQVAGWSMRTGLVLLHWADRLDGVVCAAHPDIVAALDVALGARAASCSVDLAEPRRIDEAQAAREMALEQLEPAWAALRRLSRRRVQSRLDDVAFALARHPELLSFETEATSWRLTLGARHLPDPALLIKRVLNGQDPEREPPLPPTRLKRRPLCLVPGSI